MDDFVGGHTRHSGAGDGDLAVVGAGDHERVDPVDAAVAGQDAAYKINRRELVDKAAGGGAELLPGRTVDLAEDPPVADAVHQLAALIGRAEHDHPAQLGNRVAGLDLAHEDAAHGVGDAVDLVRIRAGGEDAGTHIPRQ